MRTVRNIKDPQIKDTPSNSDLETSFSLRTEHQTNLNKIAAVSEFVERLDSALKNGNFRLLERNPLPEHLLAAGMQGGISTVEIHDSTYHVMRKQNAREDTWVEITEVGGGNQLATYEDNPLGYLGLFGQIPEAGIREQNLLLLVTDSRHNYRPLLFKLLQRIRSLHRDLRGMDFNFEG